MDVMVDRITLLKRNQISRINSYLDGSGYQLFDSAQLRFIRYYAESDVLSLGKCCKYIRGFLTSSPDFNRDMHGVHFDDLVKDRLSFLTKEYCEADYESEVSYIKAEIAKTTATYILVLGTSNEEISDCLLLNHYYFPLGIKKVGR